MDIQAEIKKTSDRMDEILTKAETEKRNLNDAEQIEFDGLDTKLRGLQASANQTRRTISIPGVQRSDEPDAVPSYGGIGLSYRQLHYGNKTLTNAETPEAFCRRALTTRTMISGSADLGGADVPSSWFAQIYSSAQADSVALPRVRTFPMPAQTLYIPGWDSEDQSAGYFGGVSGQWQGEGGTFVEKTPHTRTIQLTAHKLGLYISASREVIEDSQSLASVLGGQMISAITQMVDEAVISGNGIGQPWGILNSPATISYTRAGAAAIAFADVAGMYARLHPQYFSGAVWIAHPSTLPQLLRLADGGSRYIWQPSMGMVQGIPNMPLLGLPVVLTDKANALGTKGDLILANLGAYAFGMRAGAQLESTVAAHWTTDAISFRVILRCDGKPLLDNAITPRTGGSTLSAFVALE